MRLLSRIKELTREVVREGEDRRGVHIAQGIPLKIYMWWRQNTKQPPEKVGLCNYFWIIVLWAPLLFIRMMLAKLFSDRQFWICMSLAVAAIVIGTSIAYPGGIGVVVFGVVAFFVAAAGLIAGYGFVDYLKDKSDFDDMPKWLKFVAVAVMVVAFPTAIAGFVIGLIVIGVTSKPAKRFYGWMAEARLINGRISPFGLVLLLVATCLIALSVVGGWWIVPLAVAGLIVAIVAIRWSAERFGYYLAQRRADRRTSDQQAARQQSLKALQPVLRTIFVHLHPAHQENEGAYWSWYRGYAAQAEERHGKFVWIDIYRDTSLYRFPDWGRWDHELILAVEKELAYLSEQRRESQRQVEQQRAVLVKKVSTPFTAAGDFIILLAQFIYAAKKRICPYIELPKDR